LPEIVPPEKWRTINLDNEADAHAHNWAGDMMAALADWLANERQAKIFAESKETVKALLPADVGTVHAIGVTVARDRRNAVSIRHRSMR